MPLPTLVFFGFAVGAAAALLAATELRLSPRHAMMTASFRAFALFLTLVLLPVSVYFYVFHGDWFLLYAVDVRRIPSAVALVGFVAEAGVGVLGFLLGAALARNQRNGFGYGIASAACLLGLSVLGLWRDRLLLVGTFAQYRGNFGLRAYGGALMEAGFALGLLLLYGATYLLVRIRVAGRRA
ncbi:MAG: hypothetical protein ACHQ53_09640 [Polyangiales bacterium]